MSPFQKQKLILVYLSCNRISILLPTDLHNYDKIIAFAGKPDRRNILCLNLCCSFSWRPRYQTVSILNKTTDGCAYMYIKLSDKRIIFFITCIRNEQKNLQVYFKQYHLTVWTSLKGWSSLLKELPAGRGEVKIK